MVLPSVARIAVEQAAFHFDKLYDYYVPESLGTVRRGCRVMVPFGGRNAKRQGIVVELAEAPSIERLKPVFSVLDKEPLLNSDMT